MLSEIKDLFTANDISFDDRGDEIVLGNDAFMKAEKVCRSEVVSIFQKSKGEIKIIVSKVENNPFKYSIFHTKKLNQ